MYFFRLMLLLRHLVELGKMYIIMIIKLDYGLMYGGLAQFKPSFHPK